MQSVAAQRCLDIGDSIGDGWTVKENLPNSLSPDYNQFVERYRVTRDGETALLKTVNFDLALGDERSTELIVELSKIFEFEKNLYRLCQTKRLSAIITILESGSFPSRFNSKVTVPYFIVEYSTKNVGNTVEFDNRLDVSWLCSILHSTAKGLWQLHKEKVAHNRIDPGVLLELFTRQYKLSELGFASPMGERNPLDDISRVDPFHSTPEYLYGFSDSNWTYQHQATDVYQLGNIMCFLFTQFSYTAIFMACVEDAHHWSDWDGSFDDVKTYLELYHEQAVQCFEQHVPEACRDELGALLRQMCHPDPFKRGHPATMSSAATSLSVERYLSAFDRIAKTYIP